MLKKQGKTAENYLEKIPCPRKGLDWEVSADDGTVTLIIENRGIYNRIAQKFFKRPAVSHIQLDDIGSFVWKEMSNERSIFELGKMVSAQFGEDAEPLYERLAMFFKILERNGLVCWK